jgi:hypothetical protein
MIDKPVQSLMIHRNDDGTWSVLERREGIRLIKAGFTSHAEAKQWCEDWHPQHGIAKRRGVKH